MRERDGEIGARLRVGESDSLSFFQSVRIININNNNDDWCCSNFEGNTGIAVSRKTNRKT